MDTKLKSNKSIESNKKIRSKYIVSFISCILILVAALGMYMSYPKIEERAAKYEYNSFETDSFLRELYETNYALYYRMQAKKEMNGLEPAEFLLDTTSMSKNYSDDYVRYRESDFNDVVYDWLDNLDNYTKNLEYYAIDRDTNNVESNSYDLEVLANEELNEAIALNERYTFYITMDFDSTGRMSIKNIKGADLQVITNKYMVTRSYDIQEDYKFKPILDKTFVYGIPKDLLFQDRINGYVERGQLYAYESATTPYILTAVIFILLCALLIPYKYSRNTLGVNKIVKVPFEILIFIGIMAMVCTVLSSGTIIMPTATGDLYASILQLTNSENVAFQLCNLANIVYWFVCFALLFISGVVLKHIWSKGILNYLREKSLIVKILIFAKNKLIKIYNYAINIDLKDKNTKKVITLLGINFVIVSLMCVGWFFGIIVAIIYSVILFRIIIKHLDNISNKYNKLLEATNKIADGNLDVTIDEELGVFNPFKTEIESIQKGFKNAVNEEVKSQRMKTELISNVSHDLKTPLTSIITYVDLLKDENLSIEKRRDYLETLDRKSERLRELIEDLFEVSRATSGNINLNIVDVDVVSMVKQTLLEHDDKISQANLMVRKNLPEGKVILSLDSQRMFRVFENLIINITKYAMPGSRVYVDIIDSEDKVEIILKNMAASEIHFNVDEIVERFVRGDKSRNTEGSGLGLAIAKSFVELQEGQLKINVDGDLFKVTIIFNK